MCMADKSVRGFEVEFDKMPNPIRSNSLKDSQFHMKAMTPEVMMKVTEMQQKDLRAGL